MAVMTLASARTAIEATKGTPPTCTRILYFATGVHDQQIDTIVPTELRNSYRPTFRAYQGMEHNSFTFTGDATYDDLAFWLSSAVKGGLTGSGGSADKTWAFTPSNATDDLKAFTLEFAYADLLSTVGWRVPGCQVDEFSLKFEKPNLVTYTAVVKSFKAATQITAFSGSLSDRANVSLLGTTAQTYVDTTTIGSTADANVVTSEFKLKNGLVEREPLNGTNTGTALVRPQPVDWELDVTRYFENATELNAYIAKTERKVRTSSLGPSLGGSAYSFALDNYGYWDVSKTADINGLIVANLVLKPLYDASPTTDFLISLVNSLATIT